MLAARPSATPGEIVLRGDSAFYSRKVIAAYLRAGVRFSVTVRMDTKIRRTIGTIPDDAWVEIEYPLLPVWDEEQQRFVSRAQIAEIRYTVFEDTDWAVTARLMVRRIPDLNKTVVDDQGELLPVWRYHALFTDSPFVLVQAEEQHRGHAVVEQLLAELIDGPLAHLPSGRFDANNAWLTCIGIAHKPLPRLRDAGRTRHRPRRHCSPTRDQRRRSGRPSRPDPDPASAPTLALAIRVAATMDGRPPASSLTASTRDIQAVERPTQPSSERTP